MSVRTSLGDVHCSIARTMDVIGDPWTALILRDIFAGITRFELLQKDLGLARNTLTARLDLLVERGILHRRPYSRHPPRHDYVPTEKGSELFQVIAAVMSWGDRWTAGPAGPPALIRHNTCGHHSTAKVTCSHCGGPLRLSEIASEAGPGGRVGNRTRVLGPLLASRSRANRGPVNRG